MKGSLALQIVAFTLLATAVHFAKGKQEDEKWDKFDKDNSGDITLEELKQALTEQNVQMSDDEVQKLFDFADMDGSKKITKAEFYYRILPAIRFKKMDTDKSGSITKAELEAGLKKYFGDTIKTETINELYTLADVDNDGTITYEEFLFKINPYFRFRKVDKNGDGKVTEEEFKNGMKQLFPDASDETINKLFEFGDTDKSKEITYNEFRMKIDPFFRFAKMDKDNSGTIDKSELKEGLQKYGIKISDSDLEKYWSLADANSDGKVDYAEYYDKLNPLFFFSKFDKNSDGKISQTEFTEGLKRVGASPTKCASLFSTADTNGDGSIDYEEYIKISEKMRE